MLSLTGVGAEHTPIQIPCMWQTLMCSDVTCAILVTDLGYLPPELILFQYVVVLGQTPQTLSFVWNWARHAPDGAWHEFHESMLSEPYFF